MIFFLYLYIYIYNNRFVPADRRSSSELIPCSVSTTNEMATFCGKRKRLFINKGLNPFVVVLSRCIINTTSHLISQSDLKCLMITCFRRVHFSVDRFK